MGSRQTICDDAARVMLQEPHSHQSSWQVGERPQGHRTWERNEETYPVVILVGTWDVQQPEEESAVLIWTGNPRIRG